MAHDELAWLMESIGETRATEIRTVDEQNGSGGRSLQRQTSSATTPAANSGMAKWSVLHERNAASNSTSTAETTNGQGANVAIHNLSTPVKRQPAADPKTQGTQVYVRGQWVDKYTGRPIPDTTNQDPVIANTPVASTSRQGPSAQPNNTTTSQSTRATPRQQAPSNVSRPTGDTRQQAPSNVLRTTGDTRQQAPSNVPRTTGDTRQRPSPSVIQNPNVSRSSVHRTTTVIPATTVNTSPARQQQRSPIQQRKSLYKSKHELLELRPDEMSHDKFDEMLGQLFNPRREEWLHANHQWVETFGNVSYIMRHDMMAIARLSENHTATKQYMHEFACVSDLDKHLKAARLATMYEGGHDLDRYFEERPQYLALYRLAQRQFAEKMLANNQNLQRIYGTNTAPVVHPSRSVAAVDLPQLKRDSVVDSSTRQASTARSVAASDITQPSSVGNISSNSLNTPIPDFNHSTAIQSTDVVAKVEKSIAQLDPMTGLTIAVGAWSVSPRLMQTSHDDTSPSTSDSKSESVSSDEYFSSSSPLNSGRGRGQETVGSNDQNMVSDVEHQQNNPVMLALIEKNAKSMLRCSEMMLSGFTFKGGIFYQNH